MKRNPFIIENNPSKIRDNRLKTHNLQHGGELVGAWGSSESLKDTISLRRLFIFFGLILLVLFIFFCRLFYLQILASDHWLDVADRNRLRTVKEIPARGVILDRDGESLVINSPNFVLSVIPVDFDMKEGLGVVKDLLSEYEIEFDEQELNEIFMNTDPELVERVSLIEHIDYQKAMDLMLVIGGYKGLEINSLTEREYLDGSYGLAHVLGYMGKMGVDDWEELQEHGYLLIDWIGKSGLEKQYEKILRGSLGIKRVEVDAAGRHKKVISEQDAVKGTSIVLSIDKELNRVLATSLCDRADSFGGKGAAVAVDPRNGEILAMVSCPSFDNNYFTDTKKYSSEIDDIFKDDRQPLFNRVVQGEYPPGSIFKLLVAGVGLQEGVINSRTTFLSVGGISIGEWFFPDWKAGGHGVTDVTKAIAESVNTFFYYTGGGYMDKIDGLGMAKIISWAHKFGLGEKIGIDLPVEAKGFLPSREWKIDVSGRPWYIGDTYHLSIGQGDLTLTPLQISSITSFYAQSGMLYRPHLVKAFVDDRDKTEEVMKELLLEDFIDEEYVELVRKGLRRAVVSGSAINLSDLPFTSAGKTGTAQVGGDNEPHAWFTAFAPYENPEVVVTVLIENGVEGSRSAVPVAKDFLKAWYEDKQNQVDEE